MQVVLVVLIAVLGILSQVPCHDDVILTEQEVALKLATKESYRAVSDFFDYPKWMTSVDHVDSGDFPSDNYVGAEFVTRMNMPLIGFLEYKNTITGFEFNEYFSFVTNTLFLTKHEFRVKPTTRGSSVVLLRVTSRRKNFLFRYFLGPLLRLYYNNAAVHSLVNLKMTFA